MPADDASLITFPRRSNVVPLRPDAEDAVWFSGGSLHARYGAHVRHVEPDQALHRREFWRAQCERFQFDPTRPEARLAARRWMELTRALDALDAHNHIVGKPSPYPDPAAEVAGRLAAQVAAETHPEPPNAA